MKNCEFLYNGLNEKNRTLPCVVGATGFGGLHIDSCTFADNGVMGLAISSVGQNGEVHIQSSSFLNNAGRAVLLPAHGESNYHSTIQNCNFVNNTAAGNLLGASIEVGGAVLAAEVHSGAHIQGCVIQGSAVGVFVGNNEKVTMEHMDIETGTAVNCFKGTVNAENSEINGSAIQCTSCDFKLNGSQVCS